MRHSYEDFGRLDGGLVRSHKASDVDDLAVLLSYLVRALANEDDRPAPGVLERSEPALCYPCFDTSCRFSNIGMPNLQYSIQTQLLSLVDELRRRIHGHRDLNT